MGTLYIVSTPIGNLEDITIRAIRTLFSVDAIACEDTRRTGLLLKHIRMKFHSILEETVTGREERVFKEAKLVSYYEQREKQRIPEIINALKNGLDIALISDAGTPLVSDPGFPLIREAVNDGIPLVSVPGVSAPLFALVVSGLPSDKFSFLGYPPKKGGNRKRFFESIIQSNKILEVTNILFEAPHKLVTTLEEVKEVFGDIEIVLARELTKMHEEVWRGKISEALETFSHKQPKGEFVILFQK